MRLTWLGHSGFRMEIGGEVLLIDPWLRDNPSFDESRFDEAVSGATAILLTHGHFDHASTVEEVARSTGAPVHAIFDLTGWLETKGIDCVGFNKGGAVGIGEVTVTMVHATHSSSMMIDDKPVDLGDPAGFVIAHGGRSIYVSGDTDVHSDMALIAELHRPEIGILCCGGHFTMDQERAAFAAKKFFDFKTVIPCHYKTFPLLAQDAETLKSALAGVDVVELEVMSPQDL